MSTGYGWEGIRQVYAMLLGVRHVPERLCGGVCLQRGTITSVRPLPFTFTLWLNDTCYSKKIDKINQNVLTVTVH